MKIIESYIVQVPLNQEQTLWGKKMIVLTSYGNWYISDVNGHFADIEEWKAKRLANIED